MLEVASQRSEERREIQLFLSSQTELKAPLVKINDLLECGGGSIVEVRRPGGECAKHRSLELTNVGPLPRLHGATWVGCLDRVLSLHVPEPVDGKVRRDSGIREANIQRRLDGVVPRVWSIVARRAGSDE